MERIDKREQARFIVWTHRPDTSALAPELRSMFHWMGDGKRGATSDQARNPNDTLYTPSLLMLANENNETGLALKFESESRTTAERYRAWFRHLKHEEWIVHVARRAEDARIVVMRYLGKALPPL